MSDNKTMELLERKAQIVARDAVQSYSTECQKIKVDFASRGLAGGVRIDALLKLVPEVVKKAMPDMWTEMRRVLDTANASVDGLQPDVLMEVICSSLRPVDFVRVIEKVAPLGEQDRLRDTVNHKVESIMRTAHVSIQAEIDLWRLGRENRKLGAHTVDPAFIRRNVLEAIVSLQDGSNSSVSDEELSNKLGMGIDEVRGHLDILEGEDRITTAKSHSGHRVMLNPGQRQRVRETLSGGELASRPDRVQQRSLVSEERLAALRELANSGKCNFDLCRLIRLCEELNTGFENRCFYAVIALTRAILDHIPPLFGFKRFAQVANNYGGQKSFKEAMQKLDSMCRSIADLHLHSQARQKESLPSEQQVDFSQALDLLLAEVLVILQQGTRSNG